MTHDDTMRSLRLFGSDVIPAVREMAEEMELVSPFERNPMKPKLLKGGRRRAAPKAKAPAKR